MKYPIDKELKSLSIFSGSVVGWIYPIINIGYRLRKCRSDKCISVRRVSTPGYDGEKINTLIIEPKECGKDLYWAKTPSGYVSLMYGGKHFVSVYTIK